MKCPICTTTDLLMSDRQGIEIDYCPQCRGVWLDRGELDKIIERSAVIAEQPPLAAPPRYREPEQHSPPRRQEHGNQHGYTQQHGHESYGHHKKKSLLGELFDF